MDTTIGINETFLRFVSPSGVGPHNLYFTRFVSPPLYQASIPANTNWKYSIATMQSTLSPNFPVGAAAPLRITLYVWRPSTSTKIGTILEGNSTSTVTEPAAATERANNVTFSGAGVTNMQDGDVLIFEVWFPITQVSGATGYNCDIFYDGGTVTTTDITVSDHASYIETPDTLVLTPPTTPTRFYFHVEDNTASGLPQTEQSSLTLDKALDLGSKNRIMDTLLPTGTQTELRLLSIVGTAPQNLYFSKFCSPPLYQSSIAANTWTYNFASNTTTAAANFPVAGTNQAVRVTLYVWRPSNQTKVQNIFDGTSSATANEAATPGTELCQIVTFSGAAVTGMQAGDILVFEVWFQITQATGANQYNDDFVYDGTVVTTTNNTVVSNHASFIQTPETLNLTPPPNPTRLYFHQALSTLSNLPTTELGNLTANGNFETPTINRSMDTTIGTGEVQNRNLSNATTAGQNYYFTRFVSPPLAAGQNLEANDWKYSIACRETTTSANFPVNGTGVTNGGLIRMAIYLYRPSTQLRISSIVDATSPTVVTEGAIDEKRAYNVVGTAPFVFCEEGDVIIAEIWFQIFQAAANQYFQDFFFDGTTVTETNITVTSHASFIETPQTLTFTTPGGPSTIAMTVTAVKDLINKFITKVIGALFNVQDATPTTGATGVPINTSPTVTLSDPPDPTTVTSANAKVVIHSSGVEVPSTPTLLGSTITIDPTSDLNNNVEYRISCPGGGLRRLADNTGLSATFDSTFTTVAIAPPPTFTATAVNPGDTSIDAPIAVSPQIQTSQPYLQSSVNSTNVQLLNHATSAVIPSTLELTSSNLITINPNADLAFNTTYRISCPAGGLVRESDLVGLSPALTSTFTTVAAAPSPFTVTSITPTSGSTNQPLNVVITVTLSDNYFGSSRTSSTVQLLNHATGVAVSPAPTLGNTAANNATITPNGNLATNTTYRVFLPAGGLVRVSDNATLTNAFTATFTTTATAPQQVDNWGTTWLHPTKAGGRVYHAPLTSGSTRSFGSGSRDSFGTQEILGTGQGTYTITPSAGTIRLAGTAPRIYMLDLARSQKWENVEATCYYNMVNYTGSAPDTNGFEIGLRGRHDEHSGDGETVRVYYQKIRLGNGRWTRMKEEAHPTAGTNPSPFATRPFNEGTWYGMKFVLRTMGNGHVRLQGYWDGSDGAGGGNWELVSDYEDFDGSTGWTASSGAPAYRAGVQFCDDVYVFMRTDGTSGGGLDIKKISVHEIDPLP